VSGPREDLVIFAIGKRPLLKRNPFVPIKEADFVPSPNLLEVATTIPVVNSIFDSFGQRLLVRRDYYRSLFLFSDVLELNFNLKMLRIWLNS